jgi:ATP-binding cassette subfamily B protein/subfamily B ATP-binding cassette protein MsbA
VEIYLRVLRYGLKYWKALVLSVAISLLTTLLGLFTPWTMKIIVDNVLSTHPLPGELVKVVPWLAGLSKGALLVMAALAGLGLHLLHSAAMVCWSYFHIYVEQRLGLDLKGQVFEHLQRLSFSYHDNNPIGDSIYRATEDTHYVGQVVLDVIPIGSSLVTLFGMFFIVLRLDWELALLSLLVAPFLYAAVGFYSKHINRRSMQVRELEGQSVSIIEEVLSCLRVVKAFGRESYEHARFVDQGMTSVKARIRLSLHQTVFSLIVGFVTAAGTALVLGVGGSHVLNGRLTLGELLVILSYLGSIYEPLESLSGTFTSIQTAMASAQRVFQVLDTEPDVKDRPGAILLKSNAVDVRFESVSFRYRDDVPVLEDINLVARPGEVIGIVGPTGAGKTTLVSLIPRFYDTVAGRVLINGIDVKGIRLEALRDHISVVLQEPVLFSGTIRENIAYGNLWASMDEIMAAARAANAHHFIMKLPEKYETDVGEAGAKLSVGERQRLCIARAFLRNAPILILDEPTSAIDSKTEAVIIQALDRLMKGRTTFMVAHRLSTIRHASQILVLQDHHIAERGTHAELLRAGGLYAELYQIQYAEETAQQDESTIQPL